MTLISEDGHLVAVKNLLLAVESQPNVYHIIATTIIALVSWRIWKFTIYPSLYPDEPKELPCWIPVLGHGFSFFHNSHALMIRARKHFGNSTEPFAITAFGSTFYVVTQPRHTIEVYKNVDSLSFEEFLVGLMKYLRLSSETLNKVFYTSLDKHKPGFPNPDGKPLGHFVRDMHHHQLFPGENLEYLEKTMVEWFDHHLDMPVLHRMCSPYILGEGKRSIEVPLVKWCSELFTRAGEVAYFGKALGKIAPDMATTFLVYDDLSWQVLYQYPWIFSRKMHAAMDQVQSIFVQYFRIPQDEREGDAWFTKAIENECKSLGISEDDMARFMVMVYWVVSTNTRKAAFWLLYYLMQNPSLIPIIREQTAPAFEGNKLTKPEYLHSQCPKLEQAWLETLRMCSNSASARVVAHDTRIGGKLMRKGNKILVPYRLLHFNEAAFGPEVESFRPERFEGQSGLTRGPSWRPFGGGRTMCPGHHVAKRETMLFVAMMLRRFDIEMLGSENVLEPDLGKPVLGLADRKEGQEVHIRISGRMYT